MEKFKKGDTVRVTVTCGSNIKGEMYPVDSYNGRLYARFKEGNGCQCYWNWILVSHEGSVGKSMKITNIARGILDEDYRSMIRVGWLNADLSLTEEGRDFVLGRYLVKNKVSFGKAAVELLEERKEDCK